MSRRSSSIREAAVPEDHVHETAADAPGAIDDNVRRLCSWRQAV
eukprot:CAMPEP_0177408168 /NCGR_PEP_ID=MMETSP0368-20130122/63525_1 /TAXON_ID=447022 ORGANISM="Scrippsiella hangoei-like, Strain SHHI-4" /NCGR_SAMPLE_ID=MMETSP0368 /ASSEMBLY_ACC=CAM_ASM_000363 /LENGTH=43 /DNA_ID= /DNA_START= /DNA_END= /DNA_ORIENTATION=